MSLPMIWKIGSDMLVVTGASGFLGRQVIAAARRRQLAVVAVGRKRTAQRVPGVPVIEVDDYGALEPPTGQAVLIHLAETANIGVADMEGEPYVAESRAAMARLTQRRWSHVVYASSALVYGDAIARPRRADEQVPAPTSHYAASKLAGEQLACAAGGAVARLANLYGPGMAETTALAQILSQLPEQHALRIRDGAPIRDFLWVEDAAAGLLMLATRGARGVFNIGTGIGTSIAELAGMVLAAAQQTGRAVEVAAPREGPSCCVLDVRETLASIGWRPHLSLRAGLARLLECRR